MADIEALMEKQLADQGAAMQTGGVKSIPLDKARIDIVPYSEVDGGGFADVILGADVKRVPIVAGECLLVQQSGRTIAFIGGWGASSGMWRD